MLSLQIAKANGHSLETGGAIDIVSSRVEQLEKLPGGVEKVCAFDSFSCEGVVWSNCLCFYLFIHKL